MKLSYYLTLLNEYVENNPEAKNYTVVQAVFRDEAVTDTEIFKAEKMTRKSMGRIVGPGFFGKHTQYFEREKLESSPALRDDNESNAICVG